VLARLFNTTPQFWLNLQNHYELDTAKLGAARIIGKTIQPLPQAA
jgi:plasmid maintenance system antidote protein VapI